MKREKNLKIRVGMRIFLECNRGQKYTAKEISNFLNSVLKSKKWMITSNIIAQLYKGDQGNNSALLYPVRYEVTNRGHRVYWVDYNE